MINFYNCGKILRNENNFRSRKGMFSSRVISTWEIGKHLFWNTTIIGNVNLENDINNTTSTI